MTRDHAAGNPKLWVDKLSTPARVDAEDHPLKKTTYGMNDEAKGEKFKPFCMQVSELKKLLENVVPGQGEIYSR